MCGLVGVVANHILLGTQLDAFKWMLHLDTMRGEDSTGVAFKRSKTTGGQGPKTTVVKSEGIPYRLYSKFPEIFTSRGEFEKENSFNFSWLMGHNRSKTIGAVNAKNAHPFHHGNIVGAHNGTISTGLQKLPKGNEIVGDTDSEQIFYALSKGMPLKEIVEALKGAIALSWYDASDNTYHLFRNKERTLNYYINPTNSTLFYASEAWMIRTALMKSKIPLVGEINTIPEDQHITFKLGGKDIELAKETVSRPLDPAIVYPQSDYHYGSSYYNNGFKNAHKSKPKVPHYVKAHLNNDGDNIVHFNSIKPVTGWLTMELTKEEFDKNTKLGCMCCSADLDYTDYLKKEVFWLEKDSAFCKDCANTFKSTEYKVG